MGWRAHGIVGSRNGRFGGPVGCWAYGPVEPRNRRIVGLRNDGPAGQTWDCSSAGLWAYDGLRVRVGRSPSCPVDRPRRESPELMKIFIITGCNPVGLRFYGPTIRARWVVPWGISAVACGPPIVHRMVLVSGRVAELLRGRRFLNRELGSRGGYRSRYVLFASGVRLVGVEVQRDKKMPGPRILWVFQNR